MAKVALLIGVSEYQPTLNPLPAATKDAVAMQQILSNPEIGGFDKVNALLNPDPIQMQREIQAAFSSSRKKEDLVLLFFSGHGVKDNRGNLYLATSITCKTEQGELDKATVVPARYVHDIMSDCPSKRQVVILDCCYSGAFAEGLLAKDDGSVDVKNQLGGEGRAVLTSSTSTQYSFENKGADLSIYTHYLIEGISTGLADRDSDGMVSVDELHEYAKEKVQEAAPAMKPEIYAVKEGYKIRLFSAPSNDPKLSYGRKVEGFAIRGEISPVGRTALNELREQQGLTSEEADTIEEQVLQPYREYQQKLQRYEYEFAEAIRRESPLSDVTRKELKQLQQVLGLRNDDIAPILKRLDITSLQAAPPENAPSPVKKDVSPAPPVENPAPASAVAVSPTPPASTGTYLTKQEYKNRQLFLNKVRNAWITGVLEKSLHGQVSFVLGLEERLNAVETPASMVWETPDQPQQTLPPGTRAIDQFDQLGMGRTLLILGEPGSGKTNTLLELARDLINRAEQDANLPMPVVLNLSSWKGGKQTIAEWLVQELDSQYQVPKKTGQVWVDDGQLLLLLDGLDEVRGDIRDTCLRALNQLRQERGHAEIVVCSRIQDYEALKHRLRFCAAIYIQPLNNEQIQQYLADGGDKLAAVRTALQTDTQLQELAKSPLMLNIITLAYQGMSVEDLPSMTQEHRRQHLFDAYIERMFNRRGALEQYPKQKAKHWLTWLAQRMVEESQTLFLIERMQPSWLSTETQKCTYRIRVRLIVGLLGGLIGGLLLSAFFGMDIILISGIIPGLISGLILGFNSRLNSRIILGLSSGLISAVINGSIGAFMQEINEGIFSVILGGIKLGVIIGTFNGIILGILLGLIRKEINPVDSITWSPIATIKKLIFGLTVGLIVSTIYGVIMSLNIGMGIIKFDLSNTISKGLIPALMIGLILGLMGGFEKKAEVDKRIISNQGIWRSARNAGLLAIFGLIAGLIMWMIGILMVKEPLTYWMVIFALSVGLFGGLSGGDGSGLVCIQHFILRIILWRNGYTPWNYASFLDYAAERIFLQKVGGGYIFIHRLLLEHFAQMPLEKNP